MSDRGLLAGELRAVRHACCPDFCTTGQKDKPQPGSRSQPLFFLCCRQICSPQDAALLPSPSPLDRQSLHTAGRGKKGGGEGWVLKWQLLHPGATKAWLLPIKCAAVGWAASRPGLQLMHLGCPSLPPCRLHSE